MYFTTCPGGGGACPNLTLLMYFIAMGVSRVKSGGMLSRGGCRWRGEGLGGGGGVTGGALLGDHG